MEKKENVALGCAGLLGTLLFSVIFTPILCALGGWLGGWILSWSVGGLVCNGINLLMKTSFTTDNLPVIFAALAAVGQMFRLPSNNAFKDKK